MSLRLLLMVGGNSAAFEASRAAAIAGDVTEAAEVTVSHVQASLESFTPTDLELPPAEVPLTALIELGPFDPDDASSTYERLRGAFAASGHQLHGGYLIDQVPQIDYARYWPDGEPTRGPKIVWLATRAPDYTHDGFMRRWRRHTLLARRIHVGLWRYVQGEVLAAFGGADSDVDGVAITHLRSIEDYRLRMAETPEAGQEIVDDISQFVSASQAYLTTETIVRSTTPAPEQTVLRWER